MPHQFLSANYLQHFKGQKNIPSGRHTINLSYTTFQNLELLAKNLKVGIPNLFIGILALYFSKAYNQEKLVFGIPSHGRRNRLQKK